MSGWGKEKTNRESRDGVVPPTSPLWDEIVALRNNGDQQEQSVDKRKPKSGRQARNLRLWGTVDGPKSNGRESLAMFGLQSIPNSNGFEADDGMRTDEQPILPLPGGEEIYKLPSLSTANLLFQVPPRIDTYQKPRDSQNGFAPTFHGSLTQAVLDGFTGFSRLDIVQSCVNEAKQKGNFIIENESEVKKGQEVVFSRVLGSTDGYYTKEVPDEEFDDFIRSLCKDIPGKSDDVIFSDVKKLINIVLEDEIYGNAELSKCIEKFTLSLPHGRGSMAMTKHKLFRLDPKRLNGISLSDSRNKKLSVVYVRIPHDGKVPEIGIVGVYTSEQFRKKFYLHRDRESSV